jgi:hypothetical protein
MFNIFVEMMKDLIYNPIIIGITIVGLTLLIMNWML